MKILSIDRVQASYTATFSSPVFHLWHDRFALIENLYRMLSPYGATLSDISYEPADRAPSEAAIIVTTPLVGGLKLKLDGLEWVIANFGEGSIQQAMEMLEGFATLLCSVETGFEFKNHTINYFNHSKLSEGTATDFLNSLPTKPLQTVGENRGTGLIYHWFDEDIGGLAQLAVTHSLVVADGLFIQYLTSFDKSKVDYITLANNVTKKLEDALSEIGLQVEREVENG